MYETAKWQYIVIALHCKHTLLFFFYEICVIIPNSMQSSLLLTLCKLNIIFYCSGEERDGQVYVWQGYTGNIELHSFKTFLTRPVRRVALGGDHSLILTYDDQVFACGSNEHGQLGCLEFDRNYAFDPCLVSSLSGKKLP